MPRSVRIRSVLALAAPLPALAQEQHAAAPLVIGEIRRNDVDAPSGACGGPEGRPPGTW